MGSGRMVWREGHCTYRFADGTIYEGGFRAGDRGGRGKMTYPQLLHIRGRA